tara:strand:+ start:10676 stop:11929 length:1254 start_codon:yes stop_codon:yes gene_type:complete
LDKNTLNQNKEINIFAKEDSFIFSRLNIILLFGVLVMLISLVLIYIYYNARSDDVDIVSRDSMYPFKTIPTSNANNDNDALFQTTKVYNAIVDPDYIELVGENIINTSYTDGSLLDEAEKSILAIDGFEVNNNLDRVSEKDIKFKEIDLPEPIEPSNNNSGVFIKTPTLVSTVDVDKDLNILDQMTVNLETFSMDNKMLNADQNKSLENRDFNVLVNQKEELILDKNNLIQSEFDLNMGATILTNNTETSIKLTETFIDINEEDIINKNDDVISLVAEFDTNTEFNIENRPEKLPTLKPLDIKGRMLNNNLFETLATNTANNEIFEFKKDFYGVQVASLKSLLEADNYYKNLLLRYPTLLNANNPEHINLVKVDNLGNLGTWYKVRLGPFLDRSKAVKLCSSLRDSGLAGCIVNELE